MVDLFFYRDPEEERIAEEMQEFASEFAGGDAMEWGGQPDPQHWEEGNWNNAGGAGAGAGEEWGAAGQGEGGWEHQGLNAPVAGWEVEEGGGF